VIAFEMWQLLVERRLGEQAVVQCRFSIRELAAAPDIETLCTSGI
jgi:hypothetical protein